ncbi:MAG: replication initiation protein, partial [Desulfobacteraceae bacterium]|nr:replication initiation protein [Desulfobacteraceae bacterium]
MDGLIVKKNSSLEHMTGFSLQERRFFAFCLQFFDSRPGAKSPTKIKISIADFIQTFPEYKKYRPNQIFDVLHTARQSVNNNPYRWQEPDGTMNEQDWFTGHGIGSDQITVSLNTHEKIQELFLNIRDHFIKYHMRDVGRLSTPTAWTLYEFLKERYMNGICPTWTITVEDLRARLNATDKYPRFADFYLYLIARPVKEISEHTDLKVDCQKKKKGVKIHSIIFHVKIKDQDPAVIDIEDLSKVFHQEQIRHGISPAAATRNTQQAEKTGRLSDAIQKVETAHTAWKKTGKGPFAGYLASTLTSFLFDRSLFQDTQAQDKAAAIDELKGYGS